MGPASAGPQAVLRHGRFLEQYAVSPRSSRSPGRFVRTIDDTYPKVVVCAYYRERPTNHHRQKARRFPNRSIGTPRLCEHIQWPAAVGPKRAPPYKAGGHGCVANTNEKPYLLLHLQRTPALNHKLPGYSMAVRQTQACYNQINEHEARAGRGVGVY